VPLVRSGFASLRLQNNIIDLCCFQGLVPILTSLKFLDLLEAFTSFGEVYQEVVHRKHG
jgi:hypothetical protein